MIFGQISCRADGIDGGEATELAIIVVEPVDIAVRYPVIAHTVRVGHGTVRGRRTPGAGICQAVGVFRHGQRDAAQATILAPVLDLSHHLHAPGMAIRMRIRAGTGRVGGAEERVVAIIRRQFRRAVSVVIGFGIADRLADARLFILVGGQVFPGTRDAKGRAPIIGVGERRSRITKDGGLLRGAGAGQVGGRRDTRQGMFPRAVQRHPGIGVRAGDKGRLLIIGQRVGVIQVITGAIIAHKGLDLVQGQRAHRGRGRLRPIGQRIIAAQGGCSGRRG